MCGYINSTETRTILDEDEKKCLDGFAGNENEFKIIEFYECIVMKSRCPWLSEFALDVLDHSIDSVDSERFMSNLERINSNKLLKRMSADTKGVRLWTMWEEKLVLNNVC